MFDLVSLLELLSRLRTLRRPARPKKPAKAEIIIHKALEGYRPMVAPKVRAELCTECHDRRCEQGEICRRFEQQVDQEAWEMVSHENN